MRRLLIGCVAVSLVLGCQEEDPPTVFCPPPPTELPAPPQLDPCSAGQVVLDAVFQQESPVPQHHVVLQLPEAGELCLHASSVAPPPGLGGVLSTCGRLEWDRSTVGPSTGGAPIDAGEVLTEAYPPLAIRAWRDADLAEAGLPVAFDTNAPTGGDTDLADDLGIVVISQESFTDAEVADGRVGVPDDDGRGTVLEFAFPERACVHEIGLLDIDATETATVTLMDASGSTITSRTAPSAGNGERTSADLEGACGRTLLVEMTGSGAVTHIELCDEATSGEPSTPSAAALVRVDGEVVISPVDFVDGEARVTLALDAGTHDVALELMGDPDSSLRAQARFVATDTAPLAAQDFALADLHFRSCEELNRVLETLAPERRAQLLEDLLSIGFQPGQLVVASNGYGVPSRIAPLPSEDFGLGSAAPPSDVALAWLQNYRMLFGITDPDLVFEAVGSRELTGGSHRVELRGSWRGIRIRGLTATLLIDFDGQVRQVNAQLMPFIAGPTEPVLSAEEAVSTAERVTGRQATGAAVLELLDLDRLAGVPGVALTWAVPMSGAIAWVDATDGRVRSVAADPESGFTIIEDAGDSVGGDPDDGGIPVTLTVRLDESGRYFPTTACTSDPTCPGVLAHLTLIDEFFRRSLGRAGWSDTGGGGIEADAPYTVIYDARVRRPAFNGAASFSRMGIPGLTTGVALRSGATPPDEVAILDSESLSPAVLVAPGWNNEHVLSHEFGHGVLDVESDASPNAWTMTCQAARITESVADTFAMYEAAFYDRPLDTQLIAQGGGMLLRDHRFSDSNPAPPGTDLGQCAGRRHFTQVEPSSGRLGEPFDCSPHGNSCILTKLWALGREADAAGTSVSYHGVTVGPISYGEGKRLFHDLVRSGLDLSDGYLDYGYDYLDAVARRAMDCAAGTPCPPELIPSLTAPVYAVGLWSAPQPLGGSAAVDTLVGPGVASRAGSTWIFHVSPGDGDQVSVYEDTDILDTVPGTSSRLLDRGVPVPTTTTDLAAARTDDLVDLAVVPSGGGTISLASTTSRTDPTWLPTLANVPVPGIREGLGSVTVGHVSVLAFPTPGLATLVVAERIVAGDSELVFFRKGNTSITAVPDSVGESSPALAGNQLWSFAGTNLNRRTVLVLSSGAVSFSDPIPVDIPPTGAVDGRNGGESERGLVATPFFGRTQ